MAQELKLGDNVRLNISEAKVPTMIVDGLDVHNGKVECVWYSSATSQFERALFSPESLVVLKKP